MRKDTLRKKRARRVRAKIFGTSKCPRLCVFRSLKYIYVQLIDDQNGKILAAFDSRKFKNAKNNIETAKKAGAEIAKIAADKKIKEAVFDRHGCKYHGRVKSLAEGARAGGLKF